MLSVEKLKVVSFSHQTKPTKTKKDYSKSKRCPVKGCNRIQSNINEHLLGFHRFEKNGREYIVFVELQCHVVSSSLLLKCFWHSNEKLH